MLLLLDGSSAGEEMYLGIGAACMDSVCMSSYIFCGWGFSPGSVDDDEFYTHGFQFSIAR